MKKALLFIALLALVLTPSLPASAESIMPYVRGRILLQVEEHGEAWYISPVDDRRYYLKDGATAYVIMRLLSLGITDADLSKIPVGTDPRVYEITGYSGVIDNDNDGLANRLEWGLGTSALNADSNFNGVDDRRELSNSPTDQKLVERLKGRLLLQVEGAGQVWYVNPADGKRYYLLDGPAAYSAMRYLGLGISNENLNRIEGSAMNYYDGGEVTFSYDKLSITYDATTNDISSRKFGMSDSDFVVAGVLPSSFREGTNFVNAYFAVWASDAHPYLECNNVTLPNGEAMTLTEREKLNLYVSSLKTSYSGAAAGARGESAVYRIGVAGRCYQLVTSIVESTIENFDPSLGIKAYDKKAVMDELRWALYSFVYHVNM